MEGEEAVAVVEMNARARGVIKENKQVNAVTTLILEAILLAIDNDKSNQIYCVLCAHAPDPGAKYSLAPCADRRRHPRGEDGSSENQEERRQFYVLLL